MEINRINIDKTIQHPVTGNTIAHYLNIMDIFSKTYNFAGLDYLSYNYKNGI